MSTKKDIENLKKDTKKLVNDLSEEITERVDTAAKVTEELGKEAKKKIDKGTKTIKKKLETKYEKIQDKGNHALCPSDYPDCPEDCDHCFDILSLSQGDCRACWQHYFNRTVKGWSERELEEAGPVFINSGDLLDIIEDIVNEIDKKLKKSPQNQALKDVKLLILERLYKTRIISSPEEEAVKKFFGKD